MLVTASLGASGCSSSSSGPTTSSAPSFQVLIGAGVALLQRHNPDAAAQLFEQAIARDRSSPIGYYDLGVAESAEQLSSKALSSYLTAVRVDGEYVPALYNAALLLVGRDRLVAVSFLHRVLRIKPDSAPARLHLGLDLWALHERRTAVLTQFVLAVRLDRALLTDVPEALRATVAERLGLPAVTTTTTSTTVT